MIHHINTWNKKAWDQTVLCGHYGEPSTEEVGAFWLHLGVTANAWCNKTSDNRSQLNDENLRYVLRIPTAKFTPNFTTLAE